MQDKNDTKEKKLNILIYLYFIVATGLIIVLFPKEGKFRYSFTEGKPWQYGLLTAPYDFPIYKSAEQIKTEQDTILKNFYPYFTLDETVFERELNRFKSAKPGHSSDRPSPELRRYIENALKHVYTAGIVSNDDYDFLKQNNYTVFRVLRDENKTVPYSAGDVFTLKSAYSHILNHCPSYLDSGALRFINLDEFIHENLKYDQVFSEKIKQDDLQKISPSSGMVQAGEKIIDRGEIIDGKTFNILRSLKQIADSREGPNQKQTGITIGASVLITGLMLCFLLYLVFFRKNVYAKKKDVFFLLSMSFLSILFTELAISYEFFNVYIIPYAIIPIVIRTFFESRTAQMTHLITVLICSLMVPFSYEFILLQILVCMVALYALKDLTQRSELIKCAFYIVLTYILVYIGFQLLQEGDLSKINWIMFIYFVINFIFVMFTYAFIYIIEKIFGYISNVTLIELSDINTPALTLLSERAPGTFQHSLQVSMLGTAAAIKVGANPQLVRTGALYHDLGKIENPAFFTENKIEGGVNPHDNLSFEQSARIITSHVQKGVKLAQSYGIPQAIIKFILTHHGKGKAKYFYNSQRNQYPDQPINEEAFSYSGINPDTKETAILMMADSVEAASRSLKDYNEDSIRKLVDKIIDGQIADGLFKEAPLTFKNITKIKNVFVEKLLTVYHSRISYPELNEEKKEEEKPNA
ncbi:MAG: HDIG domain-containing protein [Dysgonamonadaceae bacterium]|jgi:putative nucleotidyltransferase with HDIG domain|nr:HDIG domain-containing protein [Dysgonamonadaceae bacterium]